MPRYGIVSDIHGNAHALRAALHFLKRQGSIDHLLCLGDIVGYNPSPDTCLTLLEEHGCLSVAGNHDLIATGPLELDRCSPRAAFALRRTRHTLQDSTRQALSLLPARRVIEDEIVLTHGTLPDVGQYMTTPALVEQNTTHLQKDHSRAQLCLFGHTHRQALYEVTRGHARPLPTPLEVDLPLPAHQGVTSFLNPGSIDAARKHPPRRAELAILDTTRRTLSFHQIPYDTAAAEQAALEQGYRMTPWQERWHRRTHPLRSRL